MVFEDDSAWLDKRIAKTETLIEKYEDAIGAISGGAQSYMLDTGQTRQSVTKANLADLTRALQQLEARRAELRLRRYGAAFNARPND